MIYLKWYEHFYVSPETAEYHKLQQLHAECESIYHSM